MSGSVALQNGVYDALNADATLGALIAGIYDNPLQVADSADASEYPYITVGSANHREWDTDTETGIVANLFIHTWSRARHHIECKEIQDRVYNVLHRGTISISGFSLVGIDQVQQDAQRDPDGITIHGVQEFRIIYEEI